MASTSDWRALAACKGVDPNVFFPGRGIPLDYARSFCEKCEVRTECLGENLVEKIGVWGGTSDRERRRMRRDRYARTGRRLMPGQLT
jgi:WhiB family redox-sensing transcriptional regulator